MRYEALVGTIMVRSSWPYITYEESRGVVVGAKTPASIRLGAQQDRKISKRLNRSAVRPYRWDGEAWREMEI